MTKPRTTPTRPSHGSTFSLDARTLAQAMGVSTLVGMFVASSACSLSVGADGLSALGADGGGGGNGGGPVADAGNRTDDGSASSSPDASNGDAATTSPDGGPTPPPPLPAPAGTYDTRIGLGVDATGVPILTKDANARYIYWNPTHPSASDANAGTDPNQPKASLNNAWAALRDGMGDWLLLAKGATSADGFGDLAARNGKSAQYPIVVTTYDPADPTNVTKLRQGTVRVGTNPTGAMLYFNNAAAARTVFENIFFDKQSSSTEGVMGLGPVKKELMFYNVRFNRASVALQGDFAGNVNDKPMTDVVIRRCVFMNGYSQGHSQGLYMWATDGVTIEDSIFYHNGWQGTDRNAPVDPPDIFKHNAYFGTMTFNTIFRRNVSAAASSHGLQMRGGGVVSDNAFVNNPLALLVGGGTTYDLYRPNGVPYTVTNNVVVGSADIDSSNPRGFGIGFINTQNGGTATNNLVVNISGVSAPYNQFALTANAEFNQPTYLSWTNNIVWNWGTHGLAEYTSDTGNKFPAQTHVTLADNILPNDPASGTNRTAPVTPFPDPNRTIASFAAANGYASEQALWDAMVEHPESNWAKLIGDYIRAGFGR